MSDLEKLRELLREARLWVGFSESPLIRKSDDTWSDRDKLLEAIDGFLEATEPKPLEWQTIAGSIEHTARFEDYKITVTQRPDLAWVDWKINTSAVNFWQGHSEDLEGAKEAAHKAVRERPWIRRNS